MQGFKFIGGKKRSLMACFTVCQMFYGNFYIGFTKTKLLIILQINSRYHLFLHRIHKPALRPSGLCLHHIYKKYIMIIFMYIFCYDYKNIQLVLKKQCWGKLMEAYEEI